MKFIKGLLLFIYSIITIALIGISILYLVLDYDTLLSTNLDGEWLTINILLLFLPYLYLFLIKILGWIPLFIGDLIIFFISFCWLKTENRFIKVLTRLFAIVLLIIMILLIVFGNKVTNTNQIIVLLY